MAVMAEAIGQAKVTRKQWLQAFYSTLELIHASRKVGF